VIVSLTVIYFGGYGVLINIAFRRYYTNSQLPEIAIAIVSIIVGTVIAVLGPMTSFMKIFTELIEGEKKSPSIK
jgi:uncharacterized protein with PQ loop repeat